MSQHSFSADSSSGCSDPSFHVATTSLLRSCCNIVLYYHHFCRDLESLSRQRLVSTELDFLSQLRSNVATWLLSVINICCRDLVCYVVTKLLCIVLKPLSRPIKVCRDLVSLCSTYFCVATLRSMSRHRLISSARSMLQRWVLLL